MIFKKNILILILSAIILISTPFYKGVDSAHATLQKANFAASTLQQSITAGATTLKVAVNTGSVFPQSGQFAVVIWGAAYNSPTAAPTREIVYLTLSSGDTFTAVRAQEGTTAYAWNSGDHIAHIITAATFDDYLLLTGGTISGTLSTSAAVNEAKGTDVASASTTNIGAATGNYINVTGTTTITAFDTVQAGTRRIVKFTGALTLTYDATKLILPGGANITTSAGDTAMFISLGSGNWICVTYQPATGLPKFHFTSLTSSGNFTTPANITTSTVFKITLVGGGGGGGGTTSGTYTAASGGAGGAATFWLSGLAPSTSYAVTIGGGGTGGAGSGANNGNTGGTTSLVIGGTTYSVTGGAGGAGTSSAVINAAAGQGTASASITSLPSLIISQLTPPQGWATSGIGISAKGACVPGYGAGGYGGQSGLDNGSDATGYGAGGGGGLAGGGGGNGSAGLFTAEWIQ